MRYQKSPISLNHIGDIPKNTNINYIFKFTEDYFIPLIKNLLPVLPQPIFDILFNAVKKDITIKLFDHASYYVMATPISIPKLAESFGPSRSTLISYLGNPTNGKENRFPCSLYINFVLSHTDQILRANKFDKRIAAKSPFIIEHGVPAILTAFDVYYKSDCLTPLNFPELERPLFSMNNLSNLQLLIKDFIEKNEYNIKDTIKSFPINLTHYHIDSFWRTQYLSSLIKTFDIHINKVRNIPTITDVDGSIKVSITYRTQDGVCKYDHPDIPNINNSTPEIISVPSSYTLNLDSVINNFEYVERNLNKFFQTNIFLLDLILSYPLTEKMLHILVTEILEFESVINYLITYTLVQNNSSLDGIFFFNQLRNFCESSAKQYLEEIYSAKNRTFNYKSFKNETLVLELYSRLVPIIFKPLYNSYFQTVEEMTDFFHIYYTGEMTIGYKKSNEQISILVPDSSSE